MTARATLETFSTELSRLVAKFEKELGQVKAEGYLKPNCATTILIYFSEHLAGIYRTPHCKDTLSAQNKRRTELRAPFANKLTNVA